MVRSRGSTGKTPRPVAFATPPWNQDHPLWQSIDQRLPANHLARQISAGVALLDLTPLEHSYQGRGSLPVPPDLLLKVALYEIASGKPSPAEWFRDTRDGQTVQWLAQGLQPSRSTCYEFWHRLAPFCDAWNQQVLQTAVQAGLSSVERVAQDGTTVAACASRHRLVNQATLARRCEELQAAVAADERGEPCAALPGWMARHPQTRRPQQARYGRAEQRMQCLQAENLRRRACKRQKSEKLVVSVSDPEAVYGRDKLHVFRPLYNVQFQADLDSPFIVGYEVLAQSHDNGTLLPLVKRTRQLTGRQPQTVLADAGYVAALDLADCKTLGLTLYAPISANDFSVQQQRRPQTNQFTRLPKSAFTWQPESQSYLCPAGKVLELVSQGCERRQGGQELRTYQFRCSPDHCRVCSLASTCTPRPEQGRTVTRLEHEELLEELRARMTTPAAKALYRLRGQTVELLFADLKEHRSLRRFTSRGRAMAAAQVGALVLVHNLRALFLPSDQPPQDARPSRTLAKHAP